MSENVEETAETPSMIKAEPTPDEMRGSKDLWGRTWRWRIYTVREGENRSWTCISMLKAIPNDAPARFTWTKKTDVDGLKAYIDAVLKGNTSEALRCQECGLVTDVQPGQEPVEQMHWVRADVLIDYLLLRGGIDLPAHGTLRLYTHGKREDRETFITSDFLCALAPVLAANDPALKYPRDRSWFAVPRNKSGIPSWMGAADASTGMYAVKAEAAGEAEVEAEREVSRQVFSRHIDVVTHVQPPGAQPYFYRRMVTNEGKVIYAATAWQQAGPWKVYERDNSALMVLGLPL